MQGSKKVFATVFPQGISTRETHDEIRSCSREVQFIALKPVSYTFLTLVEWIIAMKHLEATKWSANEVRVNILINYCRALAMRRIICRVNAIDVGRGYDFNLKKSEWHMFATNKYLTCYAKNKLTPMRQWTTIFISTQRRIWSFFHLIKTPSLSSTGTTRMTRAR